MTTLEYHTSVYLEYNVQPPHSRAVQRNCRDTRYTFTPPFTTCGDFVDRVYHRLLHRQGVCRYRAEAGGQLLVEGM